jgi:hypothetical protein
LPGLEDIMKDCELLELAAKAAGYDINFAEPADGWYPHGYDKHGDVVAWWNPLTDDGDALRLAVKLKLKLDLFDYEVIVRFPGGGVAERTKKSCDLEEATRRAIVRAAAEIGKPQLNPKPF